MTRFIHFLIGVAVRHRFAVFIAGFFLIAIGVRSAFLLPMDAIPDITSLQIEVNTASGALAPEEVEKQITVPLERALAGLPGLDRMRSISKYGLSKITLIFRDDAPDAYRLRQIIEERNAETLDRLPSGATPVVPEIASGLGEIFYYQVARTDDSPGQPLSSESDLAELKRIEDYLVAPWLMEVPGVAEVSTSGGFVNEIRIEPDPAKLTTTGLTLDDLATVVRANTENKGGGIFDRAGERIVIRALSRVTTPEEIGAIALRYGAGTSPIRVCDVASVKIASAPRNGAALVDGREAVIGAVVLRRGENARAMAERLREKLQAASSELPKGIELRPLYDRGQLVNETVRTVQHNLLVGGLLVIAVLFTFLGNWRAALIVASVIPLSLCVALTGMVAWGVPGSLISLGAIDFGLIVDGAVVIVENVVRRVGLRTAALGRPLETKERLAEIESSVVEVAPSIVCGVGIIALVYLPVFALSGIEGKMFQPLAATVTMAITGALLLAVTLVPALCALTLDSHVVHGENRLVRFCKEVYRKMLHWVLSHRLRVPIAGLAVCIAAGIVFPFLGSEFIPRLDEGTSLIAFQRAGSISLDAALAVEGRSEMLLKERFPEIDAVFARVGADDLAIEPVSPDRADTYLLYTPQKTWRLPDGSRTNKEELIGAMADTLQGMVPGQTAEFVQPVEDRFNDYMAGARADVVVRIYGDDFNVLEELGNRIRNLASLTRGAADVSFLAFQKSPMLEITPNRATLATYGLQTEDVNRAVSRGLAGEKLGAVQRGDQAIDIVLRLPESVRSQGNLVPLHIRLPDGGLIGLDKVAAVSYADRINEISRDGGHRAAAVLVNVRGRDLGGFVGDLRSRIIREVQLPDGYRIEYGGQYQNFESAVGRLRWIVPSVLLVIFAILYGAFRDWKKVAIIYSGIPLAATGGIFALALREMPFSIPAAIGFIALSGIAVLNGIVLIAHFNKLLAEGGEVATAVEKGALDRLRPVLMTALVAGLGLLPMAISTGAGAEIQRPLATVIVGGVFTSTVLTLLIVPALFVRFIGKQKSIL